MIYLVILYYYVDYATTHTHEPFWWFPVHIFFFRVLMVSSKLNVFQIIHFMITLLVRFLVHSNATCMMLNCSTCTIRIVVSLGIFPGNPTLSQCYAKWHTSINWARYDNAFCQWFNCCVRRVHTIVHATGYEGQTL